MSDHDRQFALPLSLDQGAGASAVIIGSANEAAIAALSNPADWPFGTAILSGPPRSGKSLFAAWFMQQDRNAHIIVDDADTVEQTELFHHWNSAREAGKSLLLTATDREWVVSLPDLRSRLSAAMALSIGVPDDAMAADLIESHGAQRGLVLGEGAAAYLVPRIERSFAAIENIVAAIDRISLARKSAPTLSIWRAAVDAAQNPERELGGGPEQARLL